MRPALRLLADRVPTPEAAPAWQRTSLPERLVWTLRVPARFPLMHAAPGQEPKRCPVRISTSVEVPADATRLEAALRLRIARAILWGRDKERGLAANDPEAAKAYATRLERTPLDKPHAPDMLQQRLLSVVASRAPQATPEQPAPAPAVIAATTQGSLF